MHPDWELEVKRLNETKEVVSRNLIEKTVDESSLEKKMSNINKEMWEEVGVLSGFSTFDSIATFIQEIDLLKQNRQYSVENKRIIRKLEKQLNSPYFCRIDFRENGEVLEHYYIGNFGLYDDTLGEFVIYDWRAPVSSLFYEYESGKARYACPSGIVEGEILLKRQFRIERGELKLLFDSSISIQDNILQDILAENTKGKMKTIVSTIQKEQNSIIRYEGKRILVVQGPAGSGKTSIALHRVAYLLYRQREKIKVDNICLLTPNRIFSDYISTVLPELGEEEIKSYTLTEFAKKVSGESLIEYETYCERMERQLARKDTQKNNEIENIKVRTSLAFSQVLVDLIQRFEENIQLKDIKVKEMIFIDVLEFKNLLYHELKHMPIAKRLSRIEIRIMTRVKEYEEVRLEEIVQELKNNPDYISSEEIEELSQELLTRELDETKKEIKRMTTITAIKLYEQLFSNEIECDFYGSKLSVDSCELTVSYLRQNKLLYEDLVPILYLEYLIGNIEPNKDIKHVIIDEAQDYSELAYYLFSKLFTNSNITLLGDVNQNISPLSGIESLQAAGEIMDTKQCEYICCDKSYRSTVEIIKFASSLLPNKTIPYGRNGKRPHIMQYNSLDVMGNDMEQHIQNMQDEGICHIAVICYDIDSCRTIYNALKHELEFDLVSTEEDDIKSDLIIIPSYLAKGLEFDGVLIGILSEKDYKIGEEQLLYTVCTRALHRLDVFTLKNTGLINNMIVYNKREKGF